MGLLYLPPFRPSALPPDLNPIEQTLVNLKATLQRAAPRPFDAIVAALKHIVERFRPAECANDLRHSGYVQP